LACAPTPDLIAFKAALIESGICDLVVADSTFRVVSIDLESIGELTVALPLSLDYPRAGARLLRLNWDTFGMDGLN